MRIVHVKGFIFSISGHFYAVEVEIIDLAQQIVIFKTANLSNKRTFVKKSYM